MSPKRSAGRALLRSVSAGSLSFAGFADSGIMGFRDLGEHVAHAKAAKVGKDFLKTVLMTYVAFLATVA